MFGFGQFKNAVEGMATRNVDKTAKNGGGKQSSEVDVTTRTWTWGQESRREKMEWGRVLEGPCMNSAHARTHAPTTVNR